MSLILFSIAYISASLLTKKIRDPLSLDGRPRKPPKFCSLSIACQSGDLRSVKELLIRGHFSPKINDNEPIRLAAGAGHHEIVGLLLGFPSVNPGANDNEAIRTAVKNGHFEVVRLLLTDYRVDPTANGNEALRMVIANGNLKVLNLLLQHWTSYKISTDLDIVRLAIKSDNRQILEAIMAHRQKFQYREDMESDHFDPNAAFLVACLKSDIVNIRYLYLNGFVEHSDDFYLALKLLIQNPHLRNQLDEPEIDVINPESELLVMATMSLDYPTVVELLRNERTDPGVYYNTAIITAVRLRHAPIVEALLSHDKVDPSARENTALRLAAIIGDCYIAELLLRNKKVNPADLDNDAFILAVTHNRYDMVRLPLDDKRVDIRARNYEAMKIAKRLGFALVLQLLCYRLSY